MSSCGGYRRESTSCVLHIKFRVEPTNSPCFQHDVGYSLDRNSEIHARRLWAVSSQPAEHDADFRPCATEMLRVDCLACTASLSENLEYRLWGGINFLLRADGYFTGCWIDREQCP